MTTLVLRTAVMAAIAVASWLAGLQQPTGASPDRPHDQRDRSDAVVMGRTHRHVVADAKTGLQYVLHVALPPDYEGATLAFPVVYLLDSQFDFAAVAGSLPAQYEDRLIPQVIVVGITWDPAPANYSPLRQRDFTPTPIAAFPVSGHAAEFYACLTATVIPFVERTYRASRTDRSLVGSSLGGLFALYALFHDGTAFSRYVLTSPSLNYDNGVILKIEADRAARSRRLPARVFLGIGGLEAGKIEEFDSFIARIKDRNYSGLAIDVAVLPETGHNSSRAEGYLKGLRTVFRGSER